MGAAAIHVAVVPAHWNEWVPSGIFFASIAAFQLIWALLAWSHPPATLLATGVAANAAVAALWVYSRTAGQPFGPNAGETEAVQAAGICALLLECYIVMGAAWAWFRSERAQTVSGFASALVLLGANTVVAVAVTTGLASGLQGHHHHHTPVEADRQYQAPVAEPTGGHHDHADLVTQLNARANRAPEVEPALPQANSAHTADGDHHHDE